MYLLIVIDVTWLEFFVPMNEVQFLNSPKLLNEQIMEWRDLCMHIFALSTL